MAEDITESDIEKILESMEFSKIISSINDYCDNLIQNNYNNIDFNKDEKAVIVNCLRSYNVFLELINREYFVEALSILRSIFESLLMLIDINQNDEIYNLYIKIDRSRSENEMIKPGSIRRRIIEFCGKEFNFYSIDWNKEINDYYSMLCMFVHPTILKNYFNKIAISEGEKNNIKIIIKEIGLYTKYLLLLFLKFKVGNKELNNYYDLYTLNMLLEISMVEDNEKIRKILEDNKDYLHLDINSRLIENEEEKEYIEDFKDYLNENGEFNVEKFQKVLKVMTLITMINCIKSES